MVEQPEEKETTSILSRLPSLTVQSEQRACKSCTGFKNSPCQEGQPRKRRAHQCRHKVHNLLHQTTCQWCPLATGGNVVGATAEPGLRLLASKPLYSSTLPQVVAACLAAIGLRQSCFVLMPLSCWYSAGLVTSDLTASGPCILGRAVGCERSVSIISLPLPAAKLTGIV